MQTLHDINLKNQRVMIREDLNVPIQNGKIMDDTRIQRAIPTIQYALKHHAAVMLLSHLGRPEEGQFNAEFSLAPVAVALTKALRQEVILVKDWLHGVDIEPGQCVLCENVRFNEGEKANDAKLAKQMASLCDVFVMDAFATAHRAQASTVGVAQFAKIACAGPLLAEELKALHKALDDPKRPLVAIVGGSKVSTKIQLLENLIHKVDQLLVGGGIANTFLAAEGHPVGKSLFEEDKLSYVRGLMQKARECDTTIPLPKDVIVAKELNASAKGVVKGLNEVASDEMILDVGPKTQASYEYLMASAGTIVWNGPVGVFEIDEFAGGTKALGEAIAKSRVYSIAGGGDTLSALKKFNITDKISYVSTGGGAFLMLLEGQALPAVAALSL